MSGISRKLPENERTRLKKILKEVVPDDSAVIVRTAAEGASEEELTHDVARLRAQWEDIAKKPSGSAPQLLYSEPDLAIKVVRDLFNEDFSKLVVSGDEAWDTIEAYVAVRRVPSAGPAGAMDRATAMSSRPIGSTSRSRRRSSARSGCPAAAPW